MRPLAERMRPRTLEEFVGQTHLVGGARLLGDALMRRGRRMRRQRFRIAEIVRDQDQLERIEETERRRLVAAADLKRKLAESQTRVDELQQEKTAVLHTHESLENEMRAALESKDVTISQLQGKLTVNILDRVLFDSDLPVQATFCRGELVHGQLA